MVLLFSNAKLGIVLDNVDDGNCPIYPHGLHATESLSLGHAGKSGVKTWGRPDMRSNLEF